MPVVTNVHIAEDRQPELVDDAHAHVAESPVWDVARQRLWWTDLLRGELHGFDLSSGPITPVNIGQSLGFVAPAEGGALLAGTRNGFGLLNEEFKLMVSVEGEDSLRRMSDGKCDLQGRAWGGTMHDINRVDGRIYRLNPGWQLTLIRDDLKVPNGIDWSIDGQRMYITDSEGPSVEVWYYDQAIGVPVERLTAITIEPGAGQPDGITVDSEDCVWVALWGGGAIRRYSPDGERLLEIPIPCDLVTSVTFGGPELMDLYVTTARYRLSPEELKTQPHAGGIFRCQPGVQGRPANVYAS